MTHAKFLIPFLKHQKTIDPPFVRCEWGVTSDWGFLPCVHLVLSLESRLEAVTKKQGNRRVTNEQMIHKREHFALVIAKTDSRHLLKKRPIVI